VNEVLSHPIDMEELALRLGTQLRAKRGADQRRAEVEAGLRLAVIDPLTGLFNRRYALNHMENISARAAKTGRDFAVIMLDFDHFKQINDQHGHAVGDQVLAEVAMRLREKLRAMDLIARLGGEEFLIVLPDTGLGQAERIAERMCRLIEMAPVICPGPNGALKVSVTVSLGLAMGGPRRREADPAVLIEQADHALYAAKAGGRNTVRVAVDAPLMLKSTQVTLPPARPGMAERKAV
jgi:two-component system cell cycle response regulator